MKNIHRDRNFPVQVLSAFLAMFFWSVNGSAGREITYRVEEFSAYAHKKMNDHGVNALYLVSLDHVEEYLPNQSDIKVKMLRRVDKRLIPGRAVIRFLRHHRMDLKPQFRHASAIDFFGAFREGVPYTYVITPGKMVFTESTKIPLEEKSKDRYSKHYVISKMSRTVNFAGEFYVYKNRETKEVFLVFDNGSGTYRPSSAFLPQLKALLERNFQDENVGVHFVTKTFDQKIDQQMLFDYMPEPFYSAPQID